MEKYDDLIAIKPLEVMVSRESRFNLILTAKRNSHREGKAVNQK